MPSTDSVRRAGICYRLADGASTIDRLDSVSMTDCCSPDPSAPLRPHEGQIRQKSAYIRFNTATTYPGGLTTYRTTTARHDLLKQQRVVPSTQALRVGLVRCRSSPNRSPPVTWRALACLHGHALALALVEDGMMIAICRPNGSTSSVQDLVLSGILIYTAEIASQRRARARLLTPTNVGGT